MTTRTVSVPRNQLSYYKIGFEGAVRSASGEYIRTERTVAIDPIASTVTKEVIDGEAF
jgi:hypothetical protein